VLIAWDWYVFALATGGTLKGELSEGGKRKPGMGGMLSKHFPVITGTCRNPDCMGSLEEQEIGGGN